MIVSNLNKTPRDMAHYLVELITNPSEILATNIEDEIQTKLRQMYYKGAIVFNIYHKGKIFLGQCSSTMKKEDMSKMPKELVPKADYLLAIQDSNNRDRRILKTVLRELFEPENHSKLRRYFTDAVINSLRVRTDYSIDFLKKIDPDTSIHYPEFEEAFYYHLLKYIEGRKI